MAKKNYFHDIDLKKNQLTQAVLHKVSTFPTGSKEGQTVYHTVLKSIFTCIDDSGDTTLVSAWSAGQSSIVEVTGTSLVNTGSTVYITISGMILSPSISGTYMLQFSSFALTSNSTTEGEIAIFKNGIEITASIRKIKSVNNTPINTIAMVTSNGTDQFSIGFRKSSGSGSLSLVNRSFIALLS